MLAGVWFVWDDLSWDGVLFSKQVAFLHNLVEGCRTQEDQNSLPWLSPGAAPVNSTSAGQSNSKTQTRFEDGEIMGRSFA